MAGIVTFGAAMVAGFIQAVTGFGAGIFMMLFFPVFFPILNASALSASITLFASSALAWQYRRSCQWKLLLMPTCVYLLFSSTVIVLAPYLPTTLLKKSFGVLLVVLSVYFLRFAGKIKVRPNLVSATICGGISGIASGLFGIGGPPMVIYFLSALDDKEKYLATIQLFFAVTGAYNLVFRIFSGIYTAELLLYTVIGAVSVLIGGKIGTKLIERLDTETMKKLVYVFLGISGVLNLF